ncbi:hypothetical protein [Tolypothrix bouteillei]
MASDVSIPVRESIEFQSYTHEAIDPPSGFNPCKGVNRISIG